VTTTGTAVDTVRVTHAEERRLVLQLLDKLDVPALRAALQAEWLVEADLRGHASHGIQRLPVLVGRLKRGLIAAWAQPQMRWSAPTLGTLDGQHGLGPVVGCQALQAACDRASQTGAAVVAIHNANHLGLLALYVERIVARHMIGIVVTTSEALVHPWGGKAAMLGTNPIAIAIPGRPNPFILDMATGAVSRGKILALAHRDEPLSAGWAVDAHGRPAQMARDAIDGAISPFGGAKGFGLGLAIELLVGTLTSTALGLGVTGTLDSKTLCNKGDVVICIDPSTVADESVDHQVRDYLDAIRSAATAEGFQAVTVPGDRTRERRARSLREGIELPAQVWREALDLLDQAYRSELAESTLDA